MHVCVCVCVCVCACARARLRVFRCVRFCVQVFRVASVCLGSPPETICWEYRDKDKNFHRLGPLSPLEFYREHVKPLYNIQEKVERPRSRPPAPLSVRRRRGV